MKSILYLEDEICFFEFLKPYFTKNNITLSHSFELPKNLEIYDAFIIDVFFNDKELGLKFCKTIEKLKKPIFILSSTEDSSIIEKFYQSQFFNFLQKKHYLPYPDLLIQEIIFNLNLEKNSFSLAKELLTYNIDTCKKILVKIKNNSSILIQGKKNTGKTYFFKKIQKYLPQPLVEKNALFLQDSFFESDFFGYKKGSFTGSFDGSEGILGKIQNGTLFIDDLNYLSPILIDKIKKIFQDKYYYSIGSLTKKKCNFKLVASSSQTSSLCDSIINIASLEKRREDIPLFFDFFHSKTQDPIIFKNCFIDYMKNNYKKEIGCFFKDLTFLYNTGKKIFYEKDARLIKS